jgi:lysophospholipase L1-like esterase
MNMIECLIVGDSIAVGVSQVRTECQSIVKSGINSSDWNKKHLHKLKPTKTLIISLGANDLGVYTEGNIRSLRTYAQAERVFWLLPSQKLKPKQVEAVKKVASEFGDMVIPRPESNISSDGVHPNYKGYKILGEQVR